MCGDGEKKQTKRLLQNAVRASQSAVNRALLDDWPTDTRRDD